MLERIVEFDRIRNTKYIRILKIHRIPNTEYIRFLKNEQIRIPNSAIQTQLFEQFEQYTNSLTNYKLFAIFVIRICLLSHILAIIFINVNESMTLQCIFCTKNKFLQSGILIQSSSLDLIIGFLLFSYSALTIRIVRIVRIVFGTHKMNEYEYRIPLFGPNYSNSRIVRIIRPNTEPNLT